MNPLVLSTCKRCGGGFRDTIDPDRHFCTPCEKRIQKRAKWLASFWCDLEALEEAVVGPTLAFLVCCACGALFGYALAMSVIEALS